jgi:meso-butanediol dehydrogenase/(S,S)-butanediol dehydrogenase/diacetyl reductase
MLARASAELSLASQELDGAIAITCDVSNPDDVRMGFAQIASHFGGLDILVNNAAQGYPQAIEEAQDDLLKLQVEVNLLGPLYCMPEAIPMMRTCGAGDIVNISSESVHNPYPFLGFYAATKSALETLSAGIQAEIGDSDIRVTVYRSGRINGTFSQNWDPIVKERTRVAEKEAGF